MTVEMTYVGHLPEMKLDAEPRSSKCTFNTVQDHTSQGPSLHSGFLVRCRRYSQASTIVVTPDAQHQKNERSSRSRVVVWPMLAKIQLVLEWYGSDNLAWRAATISPINACRYLASSWYLALFLNGSSATARGNKPRRFLACIINRSSPALSPFRNSIRQQGTTYQTLPGAEDMSTLFSKAMSPQQNSPLPPRTPPPRAFCRWPLVITQRAMVPATPYRSPISMAFTIITNAGAEGCLVLNARQPVFKCQRDWGE